MNKLKNLVIPGATGLLLMTWVQKAIESKPPKFSTYFMDYSHLTLDFLVELDQLHKLLTIYFKKPPKSLSTVCSCLDTLCYLQVKTDDALNYNLTEVLHLTNLAMNSLHEIDIPVVSLQLEIDNCLLKIVEITENFAHNLRQETATRIGSFSWVQ